MPNFADLVGVGGDRHEVLGDRALITERRQRPVARGAGVGHRLQRRERLRGDDEQGLVGGEITGRLDEVGRVDVGDEAERHVAPGVVAQCLVRHHRAEVRAPDPDVDHVADRLPGVAFPIAGTHPLSERRHPVEHLVNLRDHVDAVHEQRDPLGHPQRHVQHRTVLRDVDPVTAEHHLDPLGQPGLLGERDQQVDRLVGDPVLGIVEVQARRLCPEPLAAARVLGEQVTEVNVADLRVMALERGPGRTLAQRRRGRLGGAHRISSRCSGHARSAAHWCSMWDIRSFHAATKLVAPSDCSFAASASTSMPASANSAKTASLSPPSTGIGVPTWP